MHRSNPLFRFGCYIGAGMLALALLMQALQWIVAALDYIAARLP